jgi:hypothetical protein
MVRKEFKIKRYWERGQVLVENGRKARSSGVGKERVGLCRA